MAEQDPLWIIGYIDAMGAIHHQRVNANQTDRTHYYFWPNVHHKRWRILWSNWQFQSLMGDNFTPEEIEDVYAFVRKHYRPPLWMIKGDEWEALGRPRSGAKYEAYRKKWDGIYEKKRNGTL